MKHNPENTNKKPDFRKLRAYAFDPSLSLKANTAAINNSVYKVKWEKLKPGPCGEYIEVVDYDPTVGKFFRPVDLDDPYLLARDGLDPSDLDPQFHQQMVYAVAMTTIENFEKALGRKIIWAPRLMSDPSKFEAYVAKLRIYPHALRDRNAYYSPQKKALLFGYFSAAPAKNIVHMPDSLVFTCLSHDIIAHEVTHAILDGMHYHYNNPTNPDVLAFHEAFADIVALFQHFTFPEVLKHQVAQTNGNLESQNLLGKLAQEFGAATGRYGSLRDAIGMIDQLTKKWVPKPPDPDDYRKMSEPHERGSILVAAVFAAFIEIYKGRVEDLLEIATNGPGILPQGQLSSYLVNRLAKEAAKAASHVLNMCIRALDYCPPVDITFGEYLRAIITADTDLVSDDKLNYRIAFIDAFQKRGIYPKGIKTMSVESLCYNCEPMIKNETMRIFKIIASFLRDYRNAVFYHTDREKIYTVSKDYIGGTKLIKGLHNRIFFKFEDSGEFEKLTGLVFNTCWTKFGVRTSVFYDGNKPGPSFRIQNLRTVSRTGPSGALINYIVFSLVQRAGVIVRNGEFKDTYVPVDTEKPPPGGFEFWGGCTMIFNLDTLTLKYAITKPLLCPDKLNGGLKEMDNERILKQYRYQNKKHEGRLDKDFYFGAGLKDYHGEPFAFLHSH